MENTWLSTNELVRAHTASLAKGEAYLGIEGVLSHRL